MARKAKFTDFIPMQRELIAVKAEITALRARLEQAEREIGEWRLAAKGSHETYYAGGFRAGIEAAATDLNEMATVLRMSGLQVHAHQADALEERANKIRALAAQKGE